MCAKSKKNWRKKAREYLAIAFGGKCTICGYNKTIAALDYHHIDPKQKDHLLSVAMRNGYAWSKIVQEARKCTIVCCRCHRELHAGTQLPDNYARFNEEYSDVIKLKIKEYDLCICGAEKVKTNDFCSQECFHKSTQKFQINKSELKLLVSKFSYEAIGRQFGVTGAAIKKRSRSLGIKLKPRKKS